MVSVNSYEYLKKVFPNRKEKIINIFLEIRKNILNYFISYFTIILISTSLTFIGFSLLKINYSLFLSILAGLLDILPILGITLVYIPLAILFYKGKLFCGYITSHSFWTNIIVKTNY